MMKNKKKSGKSPSQVTTRRNFLKNCSILPAFCLAAPSMAGGLVAANSRESGPENQYRVPLDKTVIGSGMEKLQFEWQNGKIAFTLNSSENREITGYLSLTLMFYADERNNMHEHTPDDRIRYTRNHLREPIAFLKEKQIQVSSDEHNQHQEVTFIQELVGYRVELNFRARKGESHIRSDLRIRNDSSRIQRIMMVRCGFEQVKVNGEPAKEWVSPPESYKNHWRTKGNISEIIDYDLRIATPPCGIIQPVMFVGDIEPEGCALEFSPWLSNYGAFILSNKGDINYTMYVDRYLSRHEEHYVGSLLFRTLKEGWRTGLTRFRKTVPQKMGHEVSPNIPEWAGNMRVVTFPRRFYPIGDERWMSYFRWARDMGFNATMGYGWLWKRHNDIICAIKPEENELLLDEEHGATVESVRNHNRMLDELNMKSFVWFPTTGASPYSPMVREHPDWFIRDEEGNLVGSWYRDGKPWLIDCNPLSEGYHRYWRDLVYQVIDWGFHGIFLDGVIARPSDAFDWPFPGNPHNGVYRAVQRLRAELDESGHEDFIILPESGDVMILPGAYWMNMPWLIFDQALSRSKNMKSEFKEQGRYFNREGVPKIDESQITELLELSRRVWPKGMPGRTDIGRHNDPLNLSEQDIGEMMISYFVSSVPSMGLASAHLDPGFEHYDASTGADLSRRKKALRDRWFASLKQMNAIRKQYPFIPGAEIDFDAFRSDDGAVPAFARIEGKQVMLVVGNLGREEKDVRVRLSDSEDLKLQPGEDTLAMTEVMAGKKVRFSKAELTRGKSLRLSSGEVKAWYFENT